MEENREEEEGKNFHYHVRGINERKTSNEHD